MFLVKGQCKVANNELMAGVVLITGENRGADSCRAGMVWLGESVAGPQGWILSGLVQWLCKLNSVSLKLRYCVSLRQHEMAFSAHLTSVIWHIPVLKKRILSWSGRESHFRDGEHYYISMKDYGNIFSFRILCSDVSHTVIPGTFIKKGNRVPLDFLSFLT